MCGICGILNLTAETEPGLLSELRVMNHLLRQHAPDGEAHDFVRDTFSSAAAQGRALVNNHKVLDGLDQETRFGRKIWDLLCLELWQQEFHDKEKYYKDLLQ